MNCPHCTVFVNDIGNQFLIKFGATVPFSPDNANQIRGPFDNEKRDHLAFDNGKGSHSSPLCSSSITAHTHDRMIISHADPERDPRD